jgi:hypothetical protein
LPALLTTQATSVGKKQRRWGRPLSVDIHYQSFREKDDVLEHQSEQTMVLETLEGSLKLFIAGWRVCTSVTMERCQLTRE